ncbi:MAG: TetR/AcrR family transcriptional regulator [Acidimicrobiales bacterium]
MPRTENSYPPPDEWGTKLRYLEVAAELVERDVAGEPPYVHLVSHVKLSAVAERLGTGRTALYRAWPTQLDFWQDLVCFISVRGSEWWDRPGIDHHLGTLGDEPVGGRDELEERLRTEMAQVQADRARDPGLVFRTAMAGYPPSLPLLERQAEVERAERVRSAGILARALQDAGLRPVAPLTTLDLVTGLVIIADGAAMMGRSWRWALDRRVTLAGSDRTWTMLGLGAVALLDAMTEPGSHDRGSVAGAEPESPVVIDEEPRWTELQQAVLEAGAAMFAESVTDGIAGVQEALGHVTIPRVAAAAGVTRRQLYHLWDSHSALRFDLVDHLSRLEGVDYFGRLDAAADAAALADPRRFALELVDAVNAYRRGPWPPPPMWRLALAGYRGGEGLVLDRARITKRGVDQQAERIGGFVALTGGTLRPGLDTTDVAALTLMAAGGSERLYRIDRDAQRMDVPWRGGSYSLFAIVNQAIADWCVQRPD